MDARTPGGARPRHRADLELVRRARAKDPQAVRRFLDRMLCVRRFLAHRNRRMGRPLGAEELEDVVQDTLLVLWRKLEGYRGEGSLEAWAYRTCTLELLSRLRKLDGAPRLLGDLDAGVLEARAPVARDVLELEHLYRQLDRLGSPGADVVRLKCLEQLTFDEIAERQGLPANTVKTRFYRALARLRTLMGEDRPEPAGEVR